MRHCASVQLRCCAVVLLCSCLPYHPTHLTHLPLLLLAAMLSNLPILLNKCSAQAAALALALTLR
jgi:hypothetical protein